MHMEDRRQVPRLRVQKNGLPNRLLRLCFLPLALWCGPAHGTTFLEDTSKGTLLPVCSKPTQVVIDIGPENIEIGFSKT
jgi:hypothetical protein